jgi:DNA polymerase V
MYALIDCNNFYASCERLFRPDLRHKPIIVLSSNDGCVIARSEEAKALGIAMGIPYFKIRGICKQYQIAVFSSNFRLYNDLSQRVMQVIENAWPHNEIYSIDEAFLDVTSLNQAKHEKFCMELQQTILRQTGIPTSIGIGPSKTLAKLANHIAKKELKIPVFNITSHRDYLHRVKIGDVWGIGRKWHKKMLSHGIYTAFDLATADSQYIKNQSNVMLQRIYLELNGRSCAIDEENTPPKSILSSRSFGRAQTEYVDLAQAVSSHCAIGYEKLQRHELLTQYLSVFIFADRFKSSKYCYSIDFRLAAPTDDIRYITTCAKFCLKKIYQPGIQYKKAGICFGELTPKAQAQMDLFHRPAAAMQEKAEQFIEVFNGINARFGRGTVRLAAEGFNKAWLPRTELRSPNYTTKWEELPVVMVRERVKRILD